MSGPVIKYKLNFTRYAGMHCSLLIKSYKAVFRAGVQMKYAGTEASNLICKRLAWLWAFIPTKQRPLIVSQRPRSTD